MAQRPQEKSAARLLQRKVARARMTMLLELIWPRLWLPIGVGGLFVLVSVSGLWPLLPSLVHKALLALFAVAFLISFTPLLRLRLPDRAKAIRWLEQKSGLPHRPATVLDDEPAILADAPAKALWQAHRKRAQARVRAMKAGWPHPPTERFDPYALRVPLVLALATAIGLMSHRFSPGLTEAFLFDKSTAFAGLRIDAWVTPPPYTGTPSVMLVNAAGSTQGKALPESPQNRNGVGGKTVRVPEMSQLVVRVSGPGSQAAKLVLKQTKAEGASVNTTTQSNAPSAKIIVKQEGAIRDLRAKLTRPLLAELSYKDRLIRSWRFDIVPDHPPTITLSKKTGASQRGSLRLSYRIEDDYGVVEARAHISKSPRSSKNMPGRNRARADNRTDSNTAPVSYPPENLIIPLGTPPSFALQLPKGRARKGTASTYKDLTAHPWAGLAVELVLVARDEAGKTGRSAVARFRLPERKFKKPLARAIIAQRRSLVETPIGRRQVARLLDQLTQRAAGSRHPDMTPGVYLALRSAYWRLQQARTRPTIRSVVDQLWEIALTIEDGNLSKSERELRSAQDRLMDALAKNAPPEEISRLMKELRQALDNFMRAIAQNQQNQPPNTEQKQMPGNQRTLSSRELDNILKNIEKMAKTGARDAARQMLSQLRDMLENLNTSPPQPSARDQKMRRQLDELGKMIMRQRKLLDETHQQNQQRRGERSGRQQQGEPREKQRGEQRGQQPGQAQGPEDQQEQGQGQGGNRGAQQKAGAGDLKQRQGKLLDGFNELLDQMGRQGASIPQDLMRAGSNMGRAEQALENKRLGSASRQQGKALENMRKGAAQLAEQLMKNSKGQGRQSGRGSRDPLGRAQRTSGPEFGDDVKVPRESDTRRARDILEELRRRLGQSTRPPGELDYLERLIKQF